MHDDRRPGSRGIRHHDDRCESARTPLEALTGETRRGDLDNDTWNGRATRLASRPFVQIHTPDEAYAAVQRAFYLARRESRPIM